VVLVDVIMLMNDELYLAEAGRVLGLGR